MKQLHYKQPQSELVLLPDETSQDDNPFLADDTSKAKPLVVPASSTQRGEWPIPLPERFKDWVPDVSPDAGTQAARDRRAKESRLAMGMKE
jgi:hypothetical protein